MPDITREAFLSGLRLVRDADGNVSLYGPDGDHVVKVRGNLGVDLSADQIGSWIVDACQRASRTCETCKHWGSFDNAHYCGHSSVWNPDYPVWTRAKHSCSWYRPRKKRQEVADA